jgi:hypothetical protein
MSLIKMVASIVNWANVTITGGSISGIDDPTDEHGVGDRGFNDLRYSDLAHKDTHDPEDGSDKLDCAVPSELAEVQAAAEGSSHSFARADHAHQIQHGIADNHIVTIDGTTNTPVNTDYAKFTASGLEGRSASEAFGDIKQAASKTATGAIEIATNDETAAFESESLAVTPESLGYALAGHLAYGIEWDDDEPSPTLTRIGALAGIAAGSSPGNACLPIHAKMRRCLQADDGTVNYYLDASDSTKKEDGVTASVLTGADGQVMVEIPKFYHSYAYNATTHKHQRLISFVQLPGFTLHPAFWKNGAEVDFRYMAAYEGVGYDDSTSVYFDGDDVGDAPATNWPGGTAIDTVNDKLGSVSGFAPLVNETRAEFRSIAGNRGTGWRQQDFDLIFAVQLLVYVEYASFDTQSMIGMGRTELSGGTWAKDSYVGVTGKSNGDGNGTNSVGGNSNNAYMTYRGIENVYGNIWKWVDGFNIGIGGGAHDGANDQAIMTDSGESFPVNGLIGATIKNTTDGSEGTITANSGTTITATLAGGTDNDWDTGDTWEVSGIPYVSNTDTDFADDTATGGASTYSRLTDINGDGITLGRNYYQKNLQQIINGILPSVLAGTSNTYITDYYYQSLDWRVARLGGDACFALRAGIAYWDLLSVSADDSIGIGGRLCR